MVGEGVGGKGDAAVAEMVELVLGEGLAGGQMRRCEKGVHFVYPATVDA